ncbi:MAG: hypothetical protein ACP5I6_00425 [Caldisphaera sp.]
MDEIDQIYKSLYSQQIDYDNILNIMFKENEDIPIFIDNHTWSLLKNYMYELDMGVELSRKPRGGLYISLNINKGSLFISLCDGKEILMKTSMPLEEFFNKLKEYTKNHLI